MLAPATIFEGNYSIESQANQIRSFSYVGFETQEITVSNISNKIEIKMPEEDIMLGGTLIIVGGLSYGDFEPYEPRKTAEEMKELRETQKAACKNEVVYTVSRKLVKKRIVF
jgi:phosphoribosylformylglycinamidine (FGAM) synthase-like amidotransferase family enzyme